METMTEAALVGVLLLCRRECPSLSLPMAQTNQVRARHGLQSLCKARYVGWILVDWKWRRKGSILDVIGVQKSLSHLRWSLLVAARNFIVE